MLFIPALSNAETMSEKQSRLNSELAQILEEQKAIQEAEDAAEERRRIFEDAEAEALSNKKESK